MRRLGLGVASVLVAAACGDFGGGVAGAPEFTPPGGPPGDAPTGSKWQAVEVEGNCGRLSLQWVLIDEVCGATDAPDYLAAFRAPMFRDGARIGDLMYAVDATYLWLLDVADPQGVSRHRLEAALGEPLAVAEHAGRLLIAAGSQGLLSLDLSDPFAPAVAAQVETDGPALDVFVEGDTAFVATGGGGVAVVDLTSDTLSHTLPVPGYAAAVAARDGLAYVAACDTFAIIDIASGLLLSQTWVYGAYDGDILVAPAKDVALVDEVAFVAAGRYGAVTIDVGDPSAPVVRGNCTEAIDLSFYASGVRSGDDALYVAGGEWGVKAVPIHDPLAACSFVTPMLPELPEDDGDCSSDPPWTVVPWVDLWEPPPPSKDPIQTLPFGDVVYAFGDARRIGTRAIDIKAADTLDNVGRYDEPRLLTGIAAAAGRVFAIGPAGGVFTPDPVEGLVALEVPEVLRNAVAVSALVDGRWVAAEQNAVTVEGQSAFAVAQRLWSHGISASAGRVAVPTSAGALIYDVDAGSFEQRMSEAVAELPQAIAFDGDEVVVAAPEWTHAVITGPAGAVKLEAHGAFDVDQIGDANRWRLGLPRRLLAGTAHGIVEIASLGGQAGLALHGGAGVMSMLLPAGTYTGAASHGDRLYLVSADRSSYRSQLVMVDLTPAPSIVGLQSFTGQASGVTVLGDRLYVADADRGIRVYDADVGAPLSVVELEEVSP